MKTKAVKTEKKDNTTFAFLPDMVLDHLNEAKPTEIIKEKTSESIIKKITITADPDIPNLDSIPIPETVSKKETIKPIETTDHRSLEKLESETDENLIKRFINKIKIY